MGEHSGEVTRMANSLLLDGELCVLAQAGQPEAEQILAQRYLSLVRALARPFFLAGGDSEDLLQEGMIGLLMAIRQFSFARDTQFHTYARHCIHNRLVNVIKAASRQKHSPLANYLSFSDERIDGVHTLGPEEEFLGREADSELSGRLENLLTPLENQVLRLYLTGLSYEGIAEHIRRPYKTVDNAVQRIRKKLSQ